MPFRKVKPVSQLVNSFMRRRGEDVKQERQNKNRETPLPLFIGLSIHAKTRSRDLIETIHDLELSVSYDRVLAVSTNLGNAVYRRYQEDRVVCPPNLRLTTAVLFTTTAVNCLQLQQSTTSIITLARRPQMIHSMAQAFPYLNMSQ